MYSPYDYYEKHIKGKSEDEIKTTILKLKDKMQRAKDKLECPDERRCVPKRNLGEENRISEIRECIKLGVRELKALGAGYALDGAEQRAEVFRKNLEHISKVSFCIGGYFGGDDHYFVEFKDEYIHVTAFHAPGTCDEKELGGGLTTDSGRIIFTKSELLHYLNELNMGEWLSDYWPDRFGYRMLDGTQWSIIIEYENGIPAMKFFGSNSYPYNFDRFQCLFGLSFCNETNSW